MAKLRWVIPCLVVTVDRWSNAATLTHILEEITISTDVGPVEPGKISLIQPGFAVVSLWARSAIDKPEKATARLSVIAPNKQRVAGADVQLDLSSSPRARNISRFTHFPYTGPGEYFFRFDLKVGQRWTRVGIAPLIVKLGAEEQKPESSSGSS
jgi:hypothetical protein